MTEWIRSDELVGFDDFMSITEAAKLLRISEVTLRRWIADGRVSAYRFGPRRIRLRLADLGTLLLPAQAAAQRPLRLVPMSTSTRDENAVARARALQARQLADRGGQPFPEAWGDINEMREERSRDLDDLRRCQYCGEVGPR